MQFWLYNGIMDLNKHFLSLLLMTRQKQEDFYEQDGQSKRKI